MTKLTPDQKSTREVLLAARAFNRRTMLKTSVLAGAAAVSAPWIVKDAFSSSGELNLLMWSDEYPDPVIPDFEKKTGIKVNLPSGAAQEIDTSKASLVLVIPVSGDVAVGGKLMRDDQLNSLFQAAFQRDKTTQVVLKADKGVAHGRVVNIMERAKQAGLTRLAIGTSGG